MYTLSVIVLYFFMYSFLGWVHEFIYVLIEQRRFKWVTFLRMPITPIYGLGSIAIILLVSPYVHNPFLVFLLSAAIATIVEYVGHILIEKLFHVQLWNYDDKRFNFQGRVALINSLGFGILALLLVYVIHPFLSTYIQMIPAMIAMIVAAILVGLILIDLANTTGTLARLRLSKLSGALSDTLEFIQTQLDALNPFTKPRPTLRRTRTTLLKLHRANVRRLNKAFPNARFAVRLPKKKR